MANIFPFQGNDEEVCECPHCKHVDDHLQVALFADDKEELEEILRSLYDSGRKEGYREAMIQDISVKSDILDDMEDE